LFSSSRKRIGCYNTGNFWRKRSVGMVGAKMAGWKRHKPTCMYIYVSKAPLFSCVLQIGNITGREKSEVQGDTETG